MKKSCVLKLLFSLIFFFTASTVAAVDKNKEPDNSIGVSIKNNLTIHIPGKTILHTLPEENATPDLGDNYTISSTGVYGVRIGATIHEVENKFGTPSFRFGPVGDLVVLAYGRSHWFQFKNNNLVRASSEPVILITSL